MWCFWDDIWLRNRIKESSGLSKCSLCFECKWRVSLNGFIATFEEFRDRLHTQRFWRFFNTRSYNDPNFFIISIIMPNKVLFFFRFDFFWTFWDIHIFFFNFLFILKLQHNDVNTLFIYLSLHEYVESSCEIWITQNFYIFADRQQNLWIGTGPLTTGCMLVYQIGGKSKVFEDAQGHLIRN